MSRVSENRDQSQLEWKYNNIILEPSIYVEIGRRALQIWLHASSSYGVI